MRKRKFRTRNDKVNRNKKQKIAQQVCKKTWTLQEILGDQKNN